MAYDTPAPTCELPLGVRYIQIYVSGELKGFRDENLLVGAIGKAELELNVLAFRIDRFDRLNHKNKP
ncbi:MAG: hypothetical protein WA766_13845 [Candidatus Acidiferrales bacterium]